MDDAIRRLRQQIRTHTRGQTGTSIRYPAAVREAAVRLALDGVHAGISVRRTADGLGLRAPTLYLWLSRKSAMRLRPVAVAERVEPAVEAGQTRPVLVTPNGHRIEGLDAVGLLALLRELS